MRAGTTFQLYCFEELKKKLKIKKTRLAVVSEVTIHGHKSEYVNPSQKDGYKLKATRNTKRRNTVENFASGEPRIFQTRRVVRDWEVLRGRVEGGKWESERDGGGRGKGKGRGKGEGEKGSQSLWRDLEGRTTTEQGGQCLATSHQARNDDGAADYKLSSASEIAGAAQQQHEHNSLTTDGKDEQGEGRGTARRKGRARKSNKKGDNPLISRASRALSREVSRRVTSRWVISMLHLALMSLLIVRACAGRRGATPSSLNSYPLLALARRREKCDLFVKRREKKTKPNCFGHLLCSSQLLGHALAQSCPHNPLHRVNGKQTWLPDDWFALYKLQAALILPLNTRRQS